MDIWQTVEVQRADWIVDVYPTMVTVTRKGYGQCLRRSKERGKGMLWSKRSRLNMLKYINRIAWLLCTEGSFITMTYPDCRHAYKSKLRTAQRSRFVQELERQCRCKLPIIWRTEFEERKSGVYTGKIAPHHHLLILNETYISTPLAKTLWARIIDYYGSDLQVKVKRLTGAFGCAKYLASYVGKHRPLDIVTYLNTPFEFGRQWGILRPNLIPMLPKETYVMSPEGKQRVAEFGKAIGRCRVDEIPAGYTIFGKEMVEKALEKICPESSCVAGEESV